MNIMKRFLAAVLTMAMCLSMLPVTPNAASAEPEIVTLPVAEDTPTIEATPEEISYATLTSAVSGTCGDNLTWVLDTDGTLTISGTGNMANYSYEGDTPWASYRTSIKALVIEPGVTGIGANAFSWCTALSTAVTIPESVTYIGSLAFYCCQNMPSVSLPNSLITIGKEAFSGCTSMTSITIPGKVTTIGSSAFYGCHRLRSVTIPASVTKIGSNAFYSVTALCIVYITDLAAWCRIDFGNMYSNPAYQSSSLYLNGTLVTEPVIPEGVTSIDYAFYGNTKLTSVTIPASVTSIGYDAFSGCSGLNAVYITDLEGWCGVDFYTFSSNPLRLAGSLYLDGVLVTDLVIPEGIGSLGCAFVGCTSLKTVELPDTMTTVEAGAFSYCTGLESVTIPEGVTSIGNGAFFDCTGLTAVELPAGLESIEYQAFYGCSSLESITIPESVISIGHTAFSGCTSLTAVKLPDNMATVSNSTFYGCTGLESVTIPEGVTTIESYAFYGCSGLTQITIPSTVTSIGDNAFYGCTNLATVYNYSELDIVAGETTHGYVAYYAGTADNDPCQSGLHIGGTDTCASGAICLACGEVYGRVDSTNHAGPQELRDVAEATCGADGYTGDLCCAGCGAVLESGTTIPATGNHQVADGVCTVCGEDSFLTSGTCGESLSWYLTANYTLVIYGTGAMTNFASYSEMPWYSHRTKITAVKFYGQVTSVGNYALYGCTALKTVELPDSLTRIGGYAFYGCTGLTSVQLPDGLTSIGSSAFYGCTRLTSVQLPGSLTTIGNSTFYGCTGLKTVVLGEGIETVDRHAFYGCTGLKAVTVPASLAEVGYYAFYNCGSLSEVYISDLGAWMQIDFNDQYSNPLYNGTQMYLDGEPVTELVIPEGTTRIKQYALCGCESITSVTIPASLTQIGDNAFLRCTALTGVQLSDVAAWCQIDFDSYTSNPLYYAGNLYLNGEPVTTLVIPEGVTWIGQWAFTNCGSISEVQFPSSLRSIGMEAFCDCQGLVSVELPEGLTFTGLAAFGRCKQLVSVTIPSTVTQIGSGTFYECYALEQVYITDLAAWCQIEFADTPSGYFGNYDSYTNPLQLGAELYVNGEPVTELVIPEGVTSIGKRAFYNFRGTSVVLPSTLTQIDSLAFESCDDLREIYNFSSMDIVEGSTDHGKVAYYADFVYSGYCADGDHDPTVPTCTKQAVCRKCGMVCSGLSTVNHTGEMELKNVVAASCSTTGYSGDKYCSDCGNLVSSGSTVAKNGIHNIVYGKCSFCGNAGAIAYGTCGTDLTWYIDGSYRLYIYGTGDMTNYTSYSRVPWYNYRSYITAINFSNGITGISDYAFYHCKLVTAITIPASINHIGEDAFLGCYGLTGVYITDLAAWCGVYFESDTANPLAYAGKLYINNVLVTELVIPEGATSIHGAFWNCRQFTSVTIPDCVLTIGDYSFGYCQGLTSIRIPDSVESIGSYAFYCCTGLTDIQLSKNLTYIGGKAFETCRGLTQITLPEGLQTVGAGAFTECTGLTEVRLPDTVTSLGADAFENCTALEKVELSGGLTRIESSTFYGCTALTEIQIPEGVTYIGPSAFYGCTALESVKLPSTLTNIDDNAFYGCTALTEIQIPAAVTHIGTNAFAECTGLEAVYITDIAAWCQIDFENGTANPLCYAGELYVDGELLTELVIPEEATQVGQYAFYKYASLQTVLCPDKAIGIGTYAFAECDELVSFRVYESQSQTEAGQEVHLGAYALYDCPKLTQVQVPNGVTHIGYRAFYADAALVSVELPDSVTSIGDYVFVGCSALSAITIPAAVVEVGYMAFDGCSSLRSVTFDGGVKYMEEYAFNGCSALEAVYITDLALWCATDFYNAGANPLTNAHHLYLNGELVTELVLPGGDIGRYAFYGCTELAQVIVPEGVTSIGTSVFYNCKNLKTVYNFSSLDIVKGKTTHGYVAYYADNVYCAPCGEGNHAGGTATCTELAICIQCNQPYGQVDPTNHAGGTGDCMHGPHCERCGVEYGVLDPSNHSYGTEIRGAYDPTCLVAGYSGDTCCLGCREVITAGQSIAALGHALVEEECTRCGYLNATAKGTCGEGVKWLVYEDGRLVVYGSGSMEDYSLEAPAPWDIYREQITSVTVENSVTGIGTYAFYGLEKVTAIDLSANVTQIPAYAFYGCALERVDIGAKVTAIGDEAFGGNEMLSAVYFQGAAPEAGTDVFGDTATKPVYYYPAASGWAQSIVDDKWNGYQAIPRNAVTEGTDASGNTYVIKVVDKYNTPVVGATVVLGGVSKVTDSLGMAYFVRPEGAVSLRVSRDQFVTYTDEAFLGGAGFIDYIMLSDTASTLRGVSCNGQSIGTNMLTVNCLESGYLTLTVAGSCPRGIAGYTLIQDGRVLKTVATTAGRYTFKISSELLEEGGKLRIQMTTAEGDVLSQSLNVDIIKMVTQVDTDMLQLGDMLNISLPVVGDLPLNLRFGSEQGLYVATEGRKIMIGFNMDVKDFVDGKSPLEMKKVAEKAVESTVTGMKHDPSITLAYVGYVELEYLGDGEFKVCNTYLQLVFSASMTARAQASFYGIVGVYIEVTLSAEMKLQLSISSFDEGKIVFDDLTFGTEVALRIEGGAYLFWGAGSAGLYGQGKMGFELEIIPDFGIEKVYVKADAGVTWSVFWGWFKGDYAFWQGTLYEYERQSTKAGGAFYAAVRAAMADPANSQMNDRAYLQDRSDWLAGASGFGLSDGVYDLQTSVYGGVAPKLVTCGGTTVMVWLDDDATRNADNFQALCYSVYDAATGIWSEPRQVDGNGTFDCEFDLFTDGTNIYLLYTEQTQIMSGIADMDISDVQDIETMTLGVEVRVCRFGGGSFGSPVSLTENALCETLPVLGVQNGQLTAAWATMTADNKHNSIFISTLADGVWTAPEQVIGDQNEITALAIGSQSLVYTVDTDGDINTGDDIALIQIDSQGNVHQLASGFVADLQFAQVDGAEALLWYCGGEIYYAIGDTTYAVTGGAYPDCGEYQVVTLADGRALLSFVAGAGEGTDLYGVFLGEGGTVGEPVRLTQTDGYIDSYCLALTGEIPMVVFTLTQATITGETIQTVTDLKYTFLDLSGELSLDGAQVTEADTGYTVEAILTNGGFFPISGLTAVITDSLGVEIFRQSYEVTLLPGQSQSLTLAVPVPENLSGEDYLLTILPEGEDRNTDNNSQSLTLGWAELAITAEQTVIGLGNYLAVLVTNGGNIPGGGTLTVTGDAGQVLAELTVEDIAPGQTRQYLVDVSALTADGFVTCALGEATTGLYVLAVDASLPGAAITEPPELEFTAAGYDKYAGGELRLLITAGSGNFTGIDGLEAGVDYTLLNKTVVFTEAYLLSCPVGENRFVLRFDYDGTATTRSLTVVVADTTPIPLAGSVSMGQPVAGTVVIPDLSGLTVEAPQISYLWTIDGVTVSQLGSYTPTAEDIGKTLTLTVSGVGVYTGSLTAQAVVANPVKEIPVSPVAQWIGTDQILLVYAPGVEYSLDGQSWQTELLFEGLEPGTAYLAYARYVVDGIAGAPSIAAVMVTKIGLSGTAAISGLPQSGSLIFADLSQTTAAGSDELSYQWYRDGVAIEGATDQSYLLTRADMGKEIGLIVTGKDGFVGSLEISVTVRSFVLGDVCEDGVFNQQDLDALRLAINEELALNETQLLAADIDRDGLLTVCDLMLLRQYLNGAIESLE